jgi:hypothetical protein
VLYSSSSSPFGASFQAQFLLEEMESVTRNAYIRVPSRDVDESAACVQKDQAATASESEGGSGSFEGRAANSMNVSDRVCFCSKPWVVLDRILRFCSDGFMPNSATGQYCSGWGTSSKVARFCTGTSDTCKRYHVTAPGQSRPLAWKKGHHGAIKSASINKGSLRDSSCMSGTILPMLARHQTRQ